MSSYSPRFGWSLPGIRDLFPDLFHPRPIITRRALSPSATRCPLPRTPSDVMNPPPAATSSHSKLPSSGHSTTPDHIIDITDRPYTHAPPHGLVFPYPHIQPRIHKTQYPADRRSVPHASSGFIPRELAPDSQSRHKAEHGIGPSSFPGGERTSYLVPLSPRMVPDTTRSALRLSLEGKSIRTRSCKKRHKCKVCGSYWERPSFLKIHMVSHTGVKDFVCPICKRGFGVKSSCTRHIRTLHKE